MGKDLTKSTGLKKLPIGIQTFRSIIEEDYLYIDKTEEVYELVTRFKYVFLSRPRRFGKSLFMDTLQNVFEGNKEFFKGLYIYDKWDFSQKYPVIKIDFSGDFSSVEVSKERIIYILDRNKERLGLDLDFLGSPSSFFESLIQEAYKK